MLSTQRGLSLHNKTLNVWKYSIIIQFGTNESKDPILKRDYIAPQQGISVSKVIRYYHQVENIEGWRFWKAHMLTYSFKNEFNINTEILLHIL